MICPRNIIECGAACRGEIGLNCSAFKMVNSQCQLANGHTVVQRDDGNSLEERAFLANHVNSCKRYAAADSKWFHIIYLTLKSILY